MVRFLFPPFSILSTLLFYTFLGHARVLAEDVKPPFSSSSDPTMTSPEAHTPSSTTLELPQPQTPSKRDSLSPLPSSLLSTPTGASSNTSRRSIGGGNTTKVLADLQAGVMASRTALDNAKAQLRISQRTVAQLTRQNEDLKEGRERLRLENEGLNNVVARKERLLQEVKKKTLFQQWILPAYVRSFSTGFGTSTQSRIRSSILQDSTQTRDNHCQKIITRDGISAHRVHCSICEKRT